MRRSNPFARHVGDPVLFDLDARRKRLRRAAHAGKMDGDVFTFRGITISNRMLSPISKRNLARSVSKRGSAGYRAGDRAPGYDSSRGDWQTTKLFRVRRDVRPRRECHRPIGVNATSATPQTLIDFRHMDKSQLSPRPLRALLLGSRLELASRLVMLDDTDVDRSISETKAAIPSLGFIDVSATMAATWRPSNPRTLAWTCHRLHQFAEWVGWEGIQYDLVLAH